MFNETQSNWIGRRHFLALAASTFGLFSAVCLIDPTKLYAVTSAEKQAEADEVAKKLEEWYIQLDLLSNDYNDALEKHDGAVVAMDEAQGRIEEAENQATILQEKLGNRATTMYQQGQLSFLDVVFGSSSFSEFTTSWDLINRINDEDATLIEENKQAKAEADSAREEYEAQEKLAQQKLNEAEEAKAEAEVIQGELEAELASLEAEVAELLEQERIAEEERQRAAAAAAAAAQGSNNFTPSDGWEFAPYDGTVYSNVVDAAMSRIGCPYVWGATGPNSFDCSGLIWWSYRNCGLPLTRSGVGMGEGAPVQIPVSAAQPGDILWNSHHVGLALGGGAYVHAPYTGSYVQVAYNIDQFVGAGRWNF